MLVEESLEFVHCVESCVRERLGLEVKWNWVCATNDGTKLGRRSRSGQREDVRMPGMWIQRRDKDPGLGMGEFKYCRLSSVRFDRKRPG